MEEKTLQRVQWRREKKMIETDFDIVFVAVFEQVHFRLNIIYCICKT